MIKPEIKHGKRFKDLINCESNILERIKEIVEESLKVEF